MERKLIITAAVVPIVLLLIHGPQSAQACWRDGFGNGWNGNGPFSGWMGGDEEAEWDEMWRRQERRNTAQIGKFASALVSQENQQRSCATFC